MQHDVATNRYTVCLVFEGGANYSFSTTKTNAERVANSVSRTLTGGTPGQVRFDLSSDGAGLNYLLMDGSRVLAAHVEAND